MAAKFELKAAKGGKFMFTLKAANGKVVLTSETCASTKSVNNGIASVMQNAPEARVDDLTV
jgi:hypothetical protein